MPRPDPDYFFTAIRRAGDVLLIRGSVTGPPGAEPFLIPDQSRDPAKRTFRIGYHHNNARLPWVKLPLEHREEDVPMSIVRLEIHLPNEEIFVINSEHAATTRTTPAGTERRYLGAIASSEILIQLEGVEMPQGVLDGIGEGLKEGGFKGRLIIGRSKKTRGIFFAHRPATPWEKGFEDTVHLQDLTTPAIARRRAYQFCLDSRRSTR